MDTNVIKKFIGRFTDSLPYPTDVYYESTSHFLFKWSMNDEFNTKYSIEVSVQKESKWCIEVNRIRKELSVLSDCKDTDKVYTVYSLETRVFETVKEAFAYLVETTVNQSFI